MAQSRSGRSRPWTPVEIAPRPRRQLQFEAPIHETERHPLVLELFRRAALPKIDNYPRGRKQVI
jgi:hypothetical protein